MATPTPPQAIKDFMVSYINNRKPEYGFSTLSYSLGDYADLSKAFAACGHDTTRINVAINAIHMNTLELHSAITETRHKFENDPFPTGQTEEELLR